MENGSIVPGLAPCATQSHPQAGIQRYVTQIAAVPRDLYILQVYNKQLQAKPPA